MFQSIANWIMEKFTVLFEWLADKLTALLDWVVEQVEPAFWWFVGVVGDVGLWVVELVQVPAWFSPSSLQSAFSGIPAGVWWGIGPLMIPETVALVLSAYVVRFFIRRIPIFG